jgi:Ca-activated chloride channel family protein
MKTTTRIIALIPFMMLVLLLGGCNSGEAPETAQKDAPARTSLAIVSGSENKTLEPILKQFGRENKIHIRMQYMGSVDISHEISKGKDGGFDAVWPASSLWLSLGDKQGVVKHAKSIMRSPVVFAIKKSIAVRLGWDKTDVTVSQILDAVEQNGLRFAMTSATQSNSGASAFFGFLSAFAGRPEVITTDHLKDPQVAANIKRFLRTVDRSSGSSGWLMEMLLKEYSYFDGMVNYEAMVIETNRKLAPGQEPLYAIYPVDGLTIADSPLGYVSKGDSTKEQAFLQLQEYLLSKKIQDDIQESGRRTGLVGMQMDASGTAVFNPAWGIDVHRILTPTRIPAAPVVAEALNLYQTAFRKPSLTAFVLDYSGSMEGPGIAQLKKAMRTLLDEKIAREYLLQASPDDLTVIIPFNRVVIDTWQAEGNDPRVLQNILMKVENLQPGGGTNMYVAAAKALEILKPLSDSGKYHCAVIVMSDGESDGGLSDFKGMLKNGGAGKDIPLFTILFGDAKEDQMRALAGEMSGLMFDGRKDVVKAFREAKGYN